MLFWFWPAAVTVTVGHAHEDQQEDQEEEDEARHCVHHGRGEGDRDVGEAWCRHPPSVPGQVTSASVGVTTVCGWVRRWVWGGGWCVKAATHTGRRPEPRWVSLSGKGVAPYTPPSSLPLTHLLYTHAHFILKDPSTAADNLVPDVHLNYFLYYLFLESAWMVKCYITLWPHHHESDLMSLMRSRDLLISEVSSLRPSGNHYAHQHQDKAVNILTQGSEERSLVSC